MKAGGVRLGKTVIAPCPRCGTDAVIFESKVGDTDWHCGCNAVAPSGKDVDLRRRGVQDCVRQLAAIERGLDRGKYRYAVIATEKWLQNKHHGVLVLSGPSGLGKTTCAVDAVMKTKGRFISREEWTHLGAGWEIDHVGIRAIIEVRGVVAIDEALVMGAKKPTETDREQEALFRIVRARHDARRGTMLTTQLSRADVERGYAERGEAIARRAAEGLIDGELVDGGWIEVRE